MTKTMPKMRSSLMQLSSQRLPTNLCLTQPPKVSFWIHWLLVAWTKLPGCEPVLYKSSPLLSAVVVSRVHVCLERDGLTYLSWRLLDSETVPMVHAVLDCSLYAV